MVNGLEQGLEGANTSLGKIQRVAMTKNKPVYKTITGKEKIFASQS